MPHYYYVYSSSKYKTNIYMNYQQNEIDCVSYPSISAVST